MNKNEYNTVVDGKQYSTRTELENDGYNLNGAIVWQGTSQIDNKTQVTVILIGLLDAQRWANRPLGAPNSKTGPVLQTYIMLSDIHPAKGISDGFDYAICGDCPNRKNGSERSCYVKPYTLNGPFHCLSRNGYLHINDHPLCKDLSSYTLRMGTYGDPAAAPVEIWYDLVCRTKKRLGYTHQWRKRPEFRGLLQASCDNTQDLADAHKAGWKAFAVKDDIGQGDAEFLAEASRLAGCTIKSKHCPASVEKGELCQCIDCGLCNGQKAHSIINRHD